MGCDIHMWAEIYEETKWKMTDFLFEHETLNGPHFNEYPYWDRDYNFFALLAGVRGEEDPLQLPKGIPDDASHGYLHQCELWEGDAHNHSFYTLEYLKKKSKDIPESCKYSFDELLKNLEEFKKGEMEEEDQNIRIVFFFDN